MQRIRDGPKFFFTLIDADVNGNSHFFAGKAYLKINSLVKTPLQEFMAVERSGLWAPVLVQKWPFFQLFFLGNIGQENVFYDILERKNAFLGYKNK